MPEEGERSWWDGTADAPYCEPAFWVWVCRHAGLIRRRYVRRRAAYRAWETMRERDMREGEDDAGR